MGHSVENSKILENSKIQNSTFVRTTEKKIKEKVEKIHELCWHNQAELKKIKRICFNPILTLQCSIKVGNKWRAILPTWYAERLRWQITLVKITVQLKGTNTPYTYVTYGNYAICITQFFGLLSMQSTVWNYNQVTIPVLLSAVPDHRHATTFSLQKGFIHLKTNRPFYTDHYSNTRIIWP